MKKKELLFKNIFIRFLKERGIYTSFKNNLLCNTFESPEINSYMDSIRSYPNGAISSAFSWSDSIEGYDFWCDINDEWRLYWNEKSYINT